LRKAASLTFVLLLILPVLVTGCKKEEPVAASDPFHFVVYPGSRYLGQLTEMTKQAHRTMNPGQEPPATAIYDTDAPVEQVAEFFAKEYGYKEVAPDATNDLSAAKPAAYYRTGDLATDVKGIQDLLAKMNIQTDVTKATGTYRAADIAPLPNRPRVTIQRPYFDVTTSQVVDRTLILMARG
jgi:hypothetical protein